MNELSRRRRAKLRRSLASPHLETSESNLLEAGSAEWVNGLPKEDTEALVDARAGKPVQWVSGKGWADRKK